MELSRAVGHFSGALGNSSFGSCSSSLALDTEEAMSASSRVAQDADDAMSESSWKLWQRGRKETGGALTCRVKLEKLEVVGHLSRIKGGSVDPKGQMGHWSARTKITKEESEEQKEAEMEVDDDVPQ